MRDRGLLESACAAPRATFEGRLLHTNVFEIAAAYAYYIVGNHPFLDGNKRAGLGAALYFLQLNGITVHASNKTLAGAGLELAQGRMTIERLARLFRSRTLH